MMVLAGAGGDTIDPLATTGGILNLIIGIISIVDAYRSAKTINRQIPQKQIPQQKLEEIKVY